MRKKNRALPIREIIGRDGGFADGVTDWGASIYIPIDAVKNWKGYIEDRRPASNANPYCVICRIRETLGHAFSINGSSNGVSKAKAFAEIQLKEK